MIQGRSGNHYDYRNNHRLLDVWEKSDPAKRRVWYEGMRTYLIEIGAPRDILASFGPHECMALAVVRDGCPPETLPRSLQRFIAQCHLWWMLERFKG